jgi:hypothetical protein
VRHLSDGPGGWDGLTVERSKAESGIWVVRATCRTYSLRRTYSWARARLAISDTLTPTALLRTAAAAGAEPFAGVIPIEVNHTATISGGDHQHGVAEAVLGGGLLPFDCHNLPTLSNWGQLGHGNPSVYMSVRGGTAELGVGLLARDDAFARDLVLYQ